MSRRRDRIIGTLIVAALAIAAFTQREKLRGWLSKPAPSQETSASQGSGHAHGAPPGSDGHKRDDEISYYTCPMHPSVYSKTEGNCPICGMTLTPVTYGQERQGLVTIPAARQQLIGVRTAVVREAPMARTFRAVGRVTYDESKLSDVNLRVSGWIHKLYVERTGERVAKGKPLFTLYSPDLYQAQQDLIVALEAAGSPIDGARSEPLIRAARSRLRLLGMSDPQIEQVANSLAPIENVTFTAPAGGFVIEKDVVEGASVQAGSRVYRIAALDRVWIDADVYEADLPHVRVGDAAIVTLDQAPDVRHEARVSYVYPDVDSDKRTGRVRVELQNADLELRPGMYVSVALRRELGARLQVPTSAVVYTGPRRLVFVDLGEGHFRPQEVRVGVESNGMLEVRSGLETGEKIATSGVFLIAAEARIRSAATYWESTGQDEPTETTAPDPSTAPARGDAQQEHAEHAPAHQPKAQAPKREAKPVSTQDHTGHEDSTHAHEAKPPAPPATVYTCPMHPAVRENAPGKCPLCGMDLVPDEGDATP